MILLRSANFTKRAKSHVFNILARENTLKSIRMSTNGLASSTRRYFSFCEVYGRNPSASTERASNAWGLIFGDAPACGNYINFLKKARFLYCDKIDWGAPEVPIIIKGPKRAGGSRYRTLYGNRRLRKSRNAKIRTIVRTTGLRILPFRAQSPVGCTSNAMSLQK